MLPDLGAPPVTDVLLVEDDPADVMIVQEAFDHHAIRSPLHVVTDGECWAERVDSGHAEPPVHLTAGEIVVFTKGDPHVMAVKRKEHFQAHGGVAVVFDDEDAEPSGPHRAGGGP